MTRASLTLEAIKAKPHITWGHADGPLMFWAGQMHWLTWRERFLLWIGKETPETLAHKLWGRAL